MIRFSASLIAVALLCALSQANASIGADDSDDLYSFDDSPREEVLKYPTWFKDSFLYLNDDLNEAVDTGKSGLMVYFGQRRCAYCHKLMDVNFGHEDIAEYTRHHFDVVPIDIWGVREVTGVDGKVRTERDFALAEKADFTPTIIFYDRDGKEVFRLRGYYPPYQFRAALEYVADAHYKEDTFRDYLARGEGRMLFDPMDLNSEDFFSQPPYNLDRSRLSSGRPLAVFFEQGDCHACDVLHAQALREPAIYRMFEDFDDVQLDMWSDTKVITPSGERTTARKWAEELGLFYAPSIVFFDEQGKEILRVDSVVAIYRLRNVLNFITSKSYLTESYQKWRVTRAF